MLVIVINIMTQWYNYAYDTIINMIVMRQQPCYLHKQLKTPFGPTPPIVASYGIIQQNAGGFSVRKPSWPRHPDLRSWYLPKPVEVQHFPRWCKLLHQYWTATPKPMLKVSPNICACVCVFLFFSRSLSRHVVLNCMVSRISSIEFWKINRYPMNPNNSYMFIYLYI